MAKPLSPKQRDLLIEHIDGKVTVDRIHGDRYRTFDSLLFAGLLRDACGSQIAAVARCGHLSRPRETALTDAGRNAVAKVLADYAEVLVRAGIEEIANIKGLRALLYRRLSRGPGYPATTPTDSANVNGNRRRPGVK